MDSRTNKPHDEQVLDPSDPRAAEPGALVLTPGGYRDAELVHLATADAFITTTGGRMREVSRDGVVLTDYGPISAAGTEPRRGASSTQATRPSRARVFGEGWITDAVWSNNSGSPVSRFATTWRVPAPPASSNGQTIYLFNGLTNWTGILQPVLQWGSSPAGGGSYWSIASWYVTQFGGLVFHSQLTRVDPGDLLIGLMELVLEVNDQFTYTSEFQGIADSGLIIVGNREMVDCYEALEAYDITAASDYPDTFCTTMFGIDLTTSAGRPALTWDVEDRVTDLGQHTVVVDNSSTDGRVDLCYRTSSLTSPIVPSTAEVTAIARSTDHLDVFLTDAAGLVRSAAWQPDFADWWHGWWQPQDGHAAPGAPVHAVSRSSNKLDVFVVGSDGHIATAAWEPGSEDGWHGWWSVRNGVAALGAHVTAVSRSTDKLDIFVVGANGGVYTAAWAPGADGWHGWWRIGDVVAPQGARVHAVSRSTGKLDIFVTDLTGRVMTAAWEPGSNDGWHGWWHVNDGRALPGGRVIAGAPVTAVSRSTDKLDIFVVGIDGGVYTAAWEPGADGWHGWWPVGDLELPQAAPVHVVSRATDKLDIFATDLTGRVMTAAWAPGGEAGWQGWWRINNGTASPGAPVTAVSRSTDKLDAFVIGTDNRVYTAAWMPGSADGWAGWWRMGA